MESKTKFDFKKNSINDLRPTKDLKPVIAKKKESKEIKILRESFSRETQKNDTGIGNKTIGVNRNNEMSSTRYKNNAFSSGLKALKDIKGKNLEKVVIKSKNTNQKNDKFFEELKMRRMMGNK